MVSSDTKMKFGKFKGSILSEIDGSYLRMIYHDPKCSEELREYINENVGGVVKKFKIEDFKFPCDKIIYFSEKEAKSHINKIKKMAQKHKKPVRAYECEKCGLWHLTSISYEDNKSRISKV